ncbi:MFS transporter [Hyphococcus lacteus]|uniref:MFS transporter n=1 Tax=Hyphococcus lacteus TaxID=3143536 RepID=A0ABV3Z2C4_9PROT
MEEPPAMDQPSNPSHPTNTDYSSSATSPQERRFAIYILLFGAVCAGMGQTIVFSVLPPLARQIGLTNFQVGSIFMFSAMAWVFTGPRWGRMSDTKGRKPFILIGMFGFALSMVLFGASVQLALAGALSGFPLYLLMVAMRSLYGFIGSAGPPSAQAYIADRTSQLDRTAGIAGFSAAFGFGAMLGPGFGAATSLIAPIAPFYATAALGVVMLLAVYKFLPERTGPTQRKNRAKVKISDRRLLPFLVFALVFGVINAIPIQTIAFYFIDRLGYNHIDATRYVSIGLTAGALSSLFGQLFIVRRLRLTPARLMRIAPALMVIGHVLILSSAELLPVIIGMMVGGLGAGLAIPASTAAASMRVSAEEQGGAIGLANSAGATGFIISPMVAFSLYEWSPAAPYVLSSSLAAALLIFAWSSRAVGNAVPQSEDGPPPESVTEPAAAPYQ